MRLNKIDKIHMQVSKVICNTWSNCKLCHLLMDYKNQFGLLAGLPDHFIKH